METLVYKSILTLTDLIEETTRQYLKSLNGESKKHNVKYMKSKRFRSTNLSTYKKVQAGYKP